MSNLTPCPACESPDAGLIHKGVRGLVHEGRSVNVTSHQAALRKVHDAKFELEPHANGGCDACNQSPGVRDVTGDGVKTERW